MTSVLCIGEAMVELALSPDRPDMAQLGFAGDTLNTAIYLKRSAPDLRVGYATKLGTDAFSDRMAKMMAAERLDLHLVLRSAHHLPGLYAIDTDENGERKFTYWRENSAARRLLQPPGLQAGDLAEYSHVYLSAISLAILPPVDRSRLLRWLDRFRAGGGIVAFDSNYRPALWQDEETARQVIEAAWRLTDIGLPSLDDETALFGDRDEHAVMARLNGLGVRSGALKRGPRGPMPLDGSAVLDCAPVARVADSTAAGDSFNGAYLAARIKRRSEAQALRAGHDMAVRVLAYRGAILPRGST